MIKAVFVDFDGTVFSHSQNKIPDSSIEAINQLKQKGIKVFLCTGRSYAEMFWFDLRGIEFTGSILNNGQVILDDQGNTILEYPIEGILKDKIINIFNEKKISTYIATQDSIYINMVNDACVKCQNAVNSIIPPIGTYNNEKIYMASAFYDNDDTYNELLKLSDIADITKWTEGAIDIVPIGVCKSQAIKKLIEIYNIDISETLAIGDGENDLDMVKDCGIGIAMGNGIDLLKENADYVTSHIDDDGLYKALKHYNLI